MGPVPATGGGGEILFGILELFEQAVWLAVGLACCLVASLFVILYLLVKWATAGGRKEELEEEVKDLRAEVERLSAEEPADPSENEAR